MSIIKRLKNLWEISGWEISTKEKEATAEVGDKFAMLFKQKKMASIVDLQEPKEDI